MALPARSTWIEVSSSLMRASAAGIEDDIADASLCVNPRPALLLSGPISSQGSLSAPTNSSLAPNQIERTPHRIEREIHLPRLDVEGRARRTTLSAFRSVYDDAIRDGRGDESMRDLRIMKLIPMSKPMPRTAAISGAPRSFNLATISLPSIRARSERFSQTIASRLARPAAHDSG